MKKLILAFLILLLFSEKKLNAASNNLKGIFSGTREALDQKPEQINNEKNLKINVGPIDVSGYFHFFWSNTIQEEIYNVTDTNSQIENEGALNFLYNNELNNDNKFSINFNIKKKFNNKLRFRTVLKFENNQCGDLELSNYSKIQDNLLVNTYWIKSGSNGAWDRAINTALEINNDPRNSYALNNTLTGYDTAETYGGDVDSANLAYYIKPIENLTLGASFSPKTYYTNIENNFANYKNIIKIGAMYDHDINEKTNLKLSLLAEHGTPAKNPHNTSFDDSDLSDLHALNLGILIKYYAFSFGGTIGLWDKTGTLKNIPINAIPEFTKPKDTHYFDIAAAYNLNDKTNISISYFKSIYAQNYAQDLATSTINKPSTNGKSGKSEFHNVSLAMDYKLFDDFVVPYIEIDKFTVKDNDAISQSEKRKNNIGLVLIFGTKSKF